MNLVKGSVLCPKKRLTLTKYFFLKLFISLAHAHWMVCASFYYSLLNVFVFLCVWKKSHTFERETQTQNIPEDLSMFWCSCTSIVYLYSVPYTYINIHIHNVFIHIHIYSHHSDSFQSTSPFHSLTDILSVLSHTKNPHSQHLVPYSAHLHICFCLFTQYPLNFPANQNIFSAGRQRVHTFTVVYWYEYCALHMNP